MIRGPNFCSKVEKIAIIMLAMLILMPALSMSATPSQVATQANAEMTLLNTSARQTFEAPLPTEYGACSVTEASLQGVSSLTEFGNSDGLSQEENSAQICPVRRTICNSQSLSAAIAENKAYYDAANALENPTPVITITANTWVENLIRCHKGYNPAEETARIFRSTRAEIWAGSLYQATPVIMSASSASTRQSEVMVAFALA